MILNTFSQKGISGVLTIVFLFAVLILHYTGVLRHFDTWVLIIAVVIGVVPVFWGAIQALKEKEWASMDMLASIALTFSVIEKEWASAVFIALMLAAARLLDTLTAERMEKSIRGLMKLKPTTAKVERLGKMVTLAIEDIVLGDIVVVDTGERIAIDGEVLSGEASVDESSLTGESLPVDKGAGSTVASSTLVVSGSIKVKTLRVGKDTTLERIIALVESSRAEKPAIETLGARFGKMYLIAIFVSAGTVLLLTKDIQLVLSIVLVVCADDIAIAIPLAYLRAIGSAAKKGIVIKGGKHLEVLGRVTTLVFDKTGTLTEGTPQVVGVTCMVDMSEVEMLTLGGAAAKHSTHPLSRALVAYAKTQGNIGETESAEVLGGRGIRANIGGSTVLVGNKRLLDEEGVVVDSRFNKELHTYEEQGNSLLFIARNGTVLGCVALGDTVKADARAVIEELRSLGVSRIVMLSGDNEYAAGALAREVGIVEWQSNLLPADKVTKLKELTQDGVTAMVGDGVNDAAALSIAHVGIAMGGLGSDGAIESANIVLMHDNLRAIPDTIRLARSVHRISVQDFGIWGVTNTFGLALVFTGVIGPAGAAAYNFLSDFLPLFNSARTRLPR